MKVLKSLLVAIAGCSIASVVFAQQPCVITVKADKPTAKIQPTMWGVFFEDINMGADGGIYAELVKNRSFEFTKPMAGWAVLPNGGGGYSPFQKEFGEGIITVVNRQEKATTNPRFVRVVVNNQAKGELGLRNEGFRGMGIKKGLQYDFSLLYRQTGPGITLHVELVDSAGTSLGGTTLALTDTGTAWHKQAAHFTATATDPKAKLNIWFAGNGTVDMDMISLFPTDTWKQRPGGMRADMIQWLADLKPGFIRFPGGCIVEGYDLAQRYQWKKTIGPLEDRQLIINRWNTEIAARPAPDYFQTFGLGFYEYFQLAEDIGAEPLPILNAGMACQFNTAEVVPLEQLQPYIQDALDLIEFANGDSNSKWGATRARLGHPEPFHLKMLGVGNENWGPQYIERLKLFQKAIRAQYPDIKIVASTGAEFQGDRFNYLTTELKTIKPDLIDEHYYNRPEWFLANATRYDNYDRNGLKIFAGEYAAQSDRVVSTENRNNLRTAIAEAAFLTGLERNADIVNMASYAPLFAHAEGWQWRPDMIWVDNLQSFGTPNYYVQKLFSTNKGTDVVAALANGKPLTGQDSLYASAVLDKKSGDVLLRIVNAGSVSKPICFTVDGVKKLSTQALVSTLTAPSPEAENSIEKPTEVSPVENHIQTNGKKVSFTLPPNSLTVIRAGIK